MTHRDLDRARRAPTAPLGAGEPGRGSLAPLQWIGIAFLAVVAVAGAAGMIEMCRFWFG